MMKVFKMIFAISIFLLLLSGCDFTTVDKMYALPRRPDSYFDLQNAIDAAMVGREYCAPKAGDHQQIVQTADLDGDAQDEYLLFAKENSQQPLRILIFQKTQDKFALMDTISCNGTIFDQVAYAQMDDKPGFEIIVGRQLSDQVMRFVSVYTLKDGRAEQMLNTGYKAFLPADLDEDGFTELFILRPGPEENDEAIAELYGIEKGAMERSMEVSLSGIAENVKRLVFGRLQGGAPAVYVASQVGEDALVTDAYTAIDGVLTNVVVSNSSGTNVKTMRNYFIFADDMDHDGVMELPSLVDMIPISQGENDDSQKLIRWYAMDKSGNTVDKLCTYHDFLAGWYMIVDSTLAERLTVAQQGNDYDFFLWDKHYRTPIRMMTVSALTGQDRELVSESEGYVTLLKTDTVIYVANLGTAAEEYGITEDNLIGRFQLISQPWNNGET